MRPVAGLIAAIVAVGATLSMCDDAQAQKSGGVLKMYHRDNPPSGSILEEATNSTVIPFMPVFNNLVLYDQHVAQNSLASIVPDLADSWSWNTDQTELTFKLHPGVKWHDGKPFTARDVQCTWDGLLLGKAEQKLRKNPRQSWYGNLDHVSVNGDNEATFHLKRPQPSFLALLASGYSPVYPCHVSPAEMRVRPVGTGPFKFVELSRTSTSRSRAIPTTGARGGRISMAWSSRSSAAGPPRSWASSPAASTWRFPGK
jgi:peptide/nickel transport system substrate-binding protein